MWSRHSRRIVPITLSTYAFCQQTLECQRWNHAKVDRRDGVCMVAQECPPSLRWRPSAPDLGRTDQVRPEPDHPYQQRPVTAAQSKARRCLPQSDVELMTEKQVLSFKPASRLQYVGDEHHEQVQDRKHHPG
jgi:hypothetical protein